ncbi:serine/threonine-protein kinase [Amycolatopsis sp. NPDC051128]|uniref:serine/threonine-protein kinase n=1 Tax=Amycolatopsis sp. NPDC051128 TaxID=3155412 RepID=UPI0034210E04
MGFEERVINGRYRLLDRVGRGAMSVVWQAKDERLDRVVAVKQLLQDPGAEPATLFDNCERAIREARLASRLRHPHAIAVHDVFEDAGSMYLVLEYLPSRSLTDLLVEQGPMTEHDVARIGHQIASALAAAHAAGILHHDVTPNNVLVTDDGTAKITDFGVARSLGESPITGDGVVVGTPAYLAPEVAAGHGGGLPSDVYSLGATLYTALEGAPPFGSGDDLIALLRRITDDELVPPAHPGPLAGVVVRMLGRDPAGRPSMPEAASLLASVAAPAAAPPVVARPRRPHRAAAAGIAAGVLSAGAVFALTPAGRPEPAAAPLEPPPATVTANHTVHATTTATPAPAPRRTASAVPSARSGCTARYEVTTSWPGGAQVQVTVHNEQPARLGGWVVSWVLPPGTDIRDLWNGTFVENGSTVVVTDAGWNALLEGHATTTFGLNQNVTNSGGEVPVLTCRPS